MLILLFIKVIVKWKYQVLFRSWLLRGFISKLGQLSAFRSNPLKYFIIFPQTLNVSEWVPLSKLLVYHIMRSTRTFQSLKELKLIFHLSCLAWRSSLNALDTFVANEGLRFFIIYKQICVLSSILLDMIGWIWQLYFIYSLLVVLAAARC